MQENIEINDQYLDENFDNSDNQLDLAKQIFSTENTVTNETVEDLKDFNFQPITIQAKKGEKLVSMMPAIKKAFDLMGDDIVELHTENESL